MKLIYYIIFTLVFFACNSKSEKTESSDTKLPVSSKQKVKKDTILVVDSIANNPFVFEVWRVSIDSILNYLPDDTKINIKSKESTYYSPKLDSIYTITFGDSKFIYVKNPKMGFLEKAIIKDDLQIFRRNLRIGDDFKKIASLIKGVESDDNKIDIIEIAWGEATSYLYLEIKDKQLIKVTFSPYVG